MERLELNKTIYGATKSHNSLDEEFVEFVPKKYTIDDLFDAYNYLFYDNKIQHYHLITNIDFMI